MKTDIPAAPQPRVIQTRVSEDGLRYRSKAAGSYYGPATSGGTISCLKCGTHRTRDALKSVVLGANRNYVCRDGCPAKS